MEVNVKSTHKKKTIKDLVVEIDSLTNRVKLLEEVIKKSEFIEKVNSVCKNINKIENIEPLVQNVDKNEDLMTNKNQNDPIKKNQVLRSFMCKDCKIMFNEKHKLKEHMKMNHPKIIHCKDCEQVFDEYWKLEKHSKDHTNTKKYYCDIFS